MMGAAPIAIPSFFTAEWYEQQKEQRISDIELAENLLISIMTLHKWKQKVGWVSGNGRKYVGRKQNPNTERMKELRTKGLTYVQIGKLFSLSAQAVAYNVKKVSV